MNTDTDTDTRYVGTYLGRTYVDGSLSAVGSMAWHRHGMAYGEGGKVNPKKLDQLLTLIILG